jgi:hypothetical protein
MRDELGGAGAAPRARALRAPASAAALARASPQPQPHPSIPLPLLPVWPATCRRATAARPFPSRASTTPLLSLQNGTLARKEHVKAELAKNMRK